jgi:phosphatidyl-myo-inositol alpha-mannosyltransferase
VTPRVLIVTTEPPDIASGGLSFFHGLLWEQLRQRNYPFKTLYLNRNRSPDSKLADFNVPVTADLPFDVMPEVTTMNTAWSTREKLQPILDSYQPDVISAHEPSSLMPFYFELDKLQFTLHASHIGMGEEALRTPWGLQGYREQRIAVQQSAALVLHSAWAQNTVHAQLAKQVAPTWSFPIGVRFNDYPSVKIRHPQGKVVVSFFARFNDSAKNFSAFYEALQLLTPEVRHHIEVRLYGAGQLPTHLQNAGLQHAGLQMLGYVTGQAKRDALAQTDIVMMPSTLESFGIIGLEALLSNCHLVATPGLGMDAYLPPECACAPDAASIAAHMTQCVVNIDSIRGKQNTSYYRNLVEKPEFSIERMTDNYIAVWQGMARK